MKIGIRFSGKGNPGYNDTFYLLHALQVGKIVEIKDLYFVIEYLGNTYVFSRDEIQDECDVKVFATHEPKYITFCTSNNTQEIQEYENIKSKYNLILLSSPGEALVSYITDDELRMFLDDGNIYVTGTTGISFVHKNLFVDKFMGPLFLYYQLGLNYINFYQNAKRKNNLVGTYHRQQYINDVNQDRPSKKSLVRNTLVNKVKDILDIDLTIYKNDYKLHPDILEPHRLLGLWVTNHVSGYSDYSTSVCNLIFESFTPLEVKENPRTSLSEKTTKAIIFSKENIFFIWHGPDDSFVFLKESGFWFLNMEFYNFTTPSADEMELSVLRTIEYLKSLKEQFQNNEEVFKHLYTKYSDKLSKNYSNFQEKLIDTSIGEKILTSLYN